MPNQGQIHVDQLLSNVSVKYKPAGLIADQVFPDVPVKKTSDLYRVYERNFKIPETQRANRARSREHQFDVSTVSYVTVRHSLHAPISDTDAENYDIADLRAETTEELTEKILMRRELECAVLMTKTAWSLNVSLAAGAEFTANTTTSNPIPVFHTGASTIIANCGMKPNFAVLPREGFIGVINHVSVLDRVKYTSADMDAGKVAALFQIPQLLVPEAAYDTAVEGQAASLQNFFGENAFIGYKPDSPGLLRPSAGYTFKKAMPLVKRWREEDRESEIIEVNIEFTTKVVASLAGYLIANVS